jgi:hypothetical protein
VAHQLIEALAGDFEPEKYHDSFEENLKTLIKARLEGEEVTPVEKPKKMAPVVDLMAALKESLAQLPKKPPQRVEAAQRESEVKAVARRRPRDRAASQRRKARIRAVATRRRFRSLDSFPQVIWPPTRPFGPVRAVRRHYAAVAISFLRTMNRFTSAQVANNRLAFFTSPR